MDNIRDLLLVEALVKVSALARVLEEKGWVSKDELDTKMTELSAALAEQIAKLASDPGTKLPKEQLS